MSAIVGMIQLLNKCPITVLDLQPPNPRSRGPIISHAAEPASMKEFCNALNIPTLRKLNWHGPASVLAQVAGLISRAPCLDELTVSCKISEPRPKILASGNIEALCAVLSKCSMSKVYLRIGDHLYPAACRYPADFVRSSNILKLSLSLNKVAGAAPLDAAACIVDAISEAGPDMKTLELSLPLDAIRLANSLNKTTIETLALSFADNEGYQSPLDRDPDSLEDEDTRAGDKGYGLYEPSDDGGNADSGSDDGAEDENKHAVDPINAPDAVCNVALSQPVRLLSNLNLPTLRELELVNKYDERMSIVPALLDFLKRTPLTDLFLTLKLPHDEIKAVVDGLSDNVTLTGLFIPSYVFGYRVPVCVRNRLLKKRLADTASLALPIARALLLPVTVSQNSTSTFLHDLPLELRCRILRYATDPGALSRRQWAALEGYAADRSTLAPSSISSQCAWVKSLGLEHWERNEGDVLPSVESVASM